MHESGVCLTYFLILGNDKLFLFTLYLILFVTFAW